MTKEQAAGFLHMSEYGHEGTPSLWASMKAAGLVAVFGASDDLMEFRGAIDDEVGACGGGPAHLTPDGLLQNDCDSDGCPHFAKLKKSAATIRAVWGKDGISWAYETEIPHAIFTVMEDGEPYCRGIVFALADVPSPTTKAGDAGAIISTLGDHRAPADICRERGWGAGTCLAGDEGYGVTIIRITAVGERSILARDLTHGASIDRDESEWCLDCRDWREVTDPLAPSADDRR